MKINIKQLIETIILEEINFLSEFRGFNLNYFKKLKTPKKMLDYADKHLPLLGEGSSRVTFGLGAGKVLKIAEASHNTFQNEKEVNFFTTPGIKPIAAKIYDFDNKNYFWIISEAVKVIGDNSDLQRKFSLSRIEMREMQIQGKLEKNFDKALEEYEKRHNTAHLSEMDMDLLRGIFYASSKGLMDIDRLDHWGLTNDGRLVVIDTGISR